MKIIRKAVLLLLAFSGLVASSQNTWLHVYYPEGSDYQGFDMTEVLDVTFDETSGTMFINTTNGTHKTYSSRMDYFTIGANVPLLRIEPDNKYINEIVSKTVYIDATLYLDGRGMQDDFSERVSIRGRGNSTWSYSKKPYRLKFESKQRLLLPKKAKSFILLANYIDGSMMRNFAAYKFGEVIGMPWINHTVPVDVHFNNLDKGSYMLTEKVGFNNGSVSLSEADELNSIMLELDNNAVSPNEIYWESAYYDSTNGFFFPVKVKDPDSPADPVEAKNWQKKWQDDFNSFLSIVETGNEADIFAECDLESLVRYIMVFNLCCNQEIDHPKSIYVYKTEGGKWNFGPCWDFDWAFGYQPTYKKGNASNWWQYEQYPSYENPLLSISYNYDNPDDGNSGVFFWKLCRTQTFQQRFREVWDDFYNNRTNEFWEAFETYQEALRPSANLQGLSASQYVNFDSNVSELRTWIENRIKYINSDPNMGLWEDGTFDKY